MRDHFSRRHLTPNGGHTARIKSRLRKLIEDQRRYKCLIDEMKGGFAFHRIIQDADGKPVDYRFLQINRAFEELVGVRREAIIGRTVLDVWPDTEQIWIERYGEVALTGNPVKFTHFFSPTGKYYDVAAYCPEPMHFAVTFEDSTESRNAFTELKVKEEFNRTLMGNIRDVIMACDTTGTVTFISPNIAKVTGVNSGEIVGRNMLEFIHPEDHEQVARDLQQAITEDFDKPTIIRLMHRDGRVVHVEENGAAATNEAGEVIGVVTVLRDISEKRQLEAQLHLAQRMEAVASLAGGLAHDFNNLLTAILGHTQLALADIQGGETGQEDIQKGLEQVEAAAGRARDLAKTLLAYTRKREYRSETFYPREVAREAVQLLMPGRAGVDFRIESGDEQWPVTADRGKFLDAMMNLCGNSLDAMPRGGILRISVSNMTGAPVSLAPGRYVRVDVRDSGSGMSRETMDKLFQPFFTTKPLGKGTGLGLASVYRFVSDHHGCIVCDSVEGEGSTFTMFLPAAGEGAMKQETACDSDAPKPLTKTSGKILIVDDEEFIRKMGRRLFERYGCEVICVSGGEEAVRVYQSTPGIDLVVLDATMPGMSGLDTLKALRSIDQGARIIISSGYNLSTDSEWISSGATAFMNKPYGMKEAALVIDEHLRREKKD